MPLSLTVPILNEADSIIIKLIQFRKLQIPEENQTLEEAPEGSLISETFSFLSNERL